MDSVLIVVRRSLLAVLLTAAGGASYSWWRDRREVAPGGPAEWPPLTDTAAPRGNPADDITEPTVRPDLSAVSDQSGDWVEPSDDGSCPLSHPIKANENSGIYHLPDGRFYNRIAAARCYPTAEAAIADGYRQSKS